LRDFHVLLDAAAAHANRAYHLVTDFDGETTTEDDDTAAVGGVDAVQGLTRLADGGENMGGDFDSG
jgi:hypothetical protein